MNSTKVKEFRRPRYNSWNNLPEIYYLGGNPYRYTSWCIKNKSDKNFIKKINTIKLLRRVQKFMI